MKCNINLFLSSNEFDLKYFIGNLFIISNFSIIKILLAIKVPNG